MIPLPEVCQLGLSARADNALRRAGINTIHDLDALSYEELLSLRNVGVIPPMRLPASSKPGRIATDRIPGGNRVHKPIPG